MRLKHYTLAVVSIFLAINGQKLLSQYKDESVNRAEKLLEKSTRDVNRSPDSARYYARQALEVSMTGNYGVGVAEANALIGRSYQVEGDFEKALKHLLRAREQHEDLDNIEGLAKVQSDLSLLFQTYSDYKSSINYAVRALRNFRLLGDSSNQANTLEIMGTLFFRQGDYDNTARYYREALKLTRHLNDSAGIATNKGNIGMMLGATGKYDEALKELQEALAINRSLGHKSFIQSNLNNIGLVYYELDNYEASMDNFKKAMQVNREIGNDLGEATLTGNIGALYYKMALEKGDDNLLDTAINKLKFAIAECKRLNSYDPTIGFYDMLAECYEEAGNAEAAFAAYRKGAVVKDSIHSINNKMALANMAVAHQLSIANVDLELSQQELTINKLELAKSRQQVILYTVSVIALGCLILIAIYFLKKARDRNESLKKTNKEYEEKVEEQMATLKKHTRVLNEITYMQAHDVREPVATILGLSNHFNYENPADPDNKFILQNLKLVTEKLDKAVREVIQKKEEL